MESRLAVRHLFDGLTWRGPVELVLAGGRLARVAPPGPGGPRPWGVVVPGWVDAHVHLDLPAPERPVHGEFTTWIRAVMASRATAGPGVAEANLAELVRGGATCFGDIDATGATRALLDRHGVAGRAYRELLGFDAGEDEARAAVEGAVAALGPEDGLSPHAPYSVSPALFRAAAATGRPLAIHVAELAEEVRLLARGDGPLRTLLEELGRWPAGHRAGGLSPVRHLDALGALSPRTLCVHLQHAGADDLALLAARGAGACVCPGTLRWFDREPPPVDRWLEAGLAVGIGTDSLASNERLSMARELALLDELCPALGPGRILRMATGMGGRALGSTTAGRLAEGGRFDAQAWREAPADDPRELERWLVRSAARPDTVFVAGHAVV
ncbi:MAG: amidohydrolase family protein [Planctomycetota bacterium]